MRDPELMRWVLKRLCDTIEATGGLQWEEVPDSAELGLGPVRDPQWADLALVYLQACRAISHRAQAQELAGFEVVNDRQVDRVDPGGLSNVRVPFARFDKYDHVLDFMNAQHELEQRRDRIASDPAVRQARSEEDVLARALSAMLDVQSRRRHPLGAPDEGIATDAAEAASQARAALAIYHGRLTGGRFVTVNDEHGQPECNATVVELHPEAGEVTVVSEHEVPLMLRVSLDRIARDEERSS